MKDIKDYRGKELLGYTVVQIIIIVLFQNPQILSVDYLELQKNILPLVTSTIFSSVICVMTFIFDSIFSDNLKYLLIYFGKARPGELIFSKIKSHHTDFRYTQGNALEKYKEIYDNMPQDRKQRRSYENDQWYKIYTKHRGSSMILGSHRDYLLCRDIYFSTLIMILLYSFTTILLKNISFSWKLIVFELVLMFFINIATRQRAKRFVDNVIALDLQEQANISIVI